MADIVPGDDQILTAIILAAQYVGMARVEMVDGDPIQPGAEILFHARHQPAGERFQILIVGTVLGADDEAELVAVALSLIEPGVAIDLVAFRPIELTAPAVAGRAVPLDIAHMRLRAVKPLSPKRDQTRLHDHAALAKGGVAIAADKHAADPCAPSDPAAGEAAPAAAGRSAPARQVGGRENTMQKLARPLAAASSPHAAKPGFETLVVRHNRGSSRQEKPEHVPVIII